MGSDLSVQFRGVLARDDFDSDLTTGECLAMASEMKAIAERCEDPKSRNQFFQFGTEWERRAARLSGDRLALTFRKRSRPKKRSLTESVEVMSD